ncbi:MAG: hypothetical protein LC772_03955 [Chloroflexi bacterium]|nr:hypothetical protein [Chloroflexota bacterium]
MILPGLGQMMNGDAMKGFMLLGAALVMISAGVTFFHPVYLFITAIAVVDAALSRSRREGAAFRSRSWA